MNFTKNTENRLSLNLACTVYVPRNLISISLQSYLGSCVTLIAYLADEIIAGRLVKSIVGLEL